MLESLGAALLNRYLSEYIDNLDSKKLQLSFLSGDIKLQDLRLKEGALDKLQLPIKIVDGHIGSLVLQIPYSNLKSKPVKLLLEDVFLIAEPDMNHEEEGQKRREQAAKLDKLNTWELTSERAMLKAANPDQKEVQSEQKQQSFTSAMVTKIVQNVQVTIRNIHVRFEDVDVGVAVGATLGELSAISTNKNWEPAFIADVGSVTHKLATLDSLAFYIDPAVAQEFSKPQRSQAERQQLLEDFKALIFDSFGAADILRPINGQGFITLNKSPSSETTPKIKADLKFEELAVALDRDQYVDALRVTDKFQKYFESLKYRSHRPKVPVKADPLAWFRYAASTVLDGVRERRRQWTWENMKYYMENQKTYIDLYKRWYREGSSDQSFTVQEKETFSRIEHDFSYDDLVFFRSLAKKDLLKERQSMRTKPQSQQTWTEWFWGAPKDSQRAAGAPSSSAGVSAASESAPPIEITEEQRQELLDVLDEPSLSKDTAAQVLLAVDFSLRSAGVRLRSKDTSLCSAGFEEVAATFCKRQSSFSYEMSVAKIEVSDLTCRNRFSEVIRVQEATDIPNKAKREPFFWFQFEHHPLDRKADSNLFVKSQSVVFVHNARLVESIGTFFSPPPDQGDTVDAILEAANRTVEELRAQTRIGLEYALEHHKTLNLKLDIKAPTIIFPLDCNDHNSAAAILDVGSLQMASDLVPPNVLNEVKSKQALQYSEADWKRLESLMYDRFTVKLCDTQILLGEHIGDLIGSLGQNSSKYHFLDKATLQFLLEMSIIPNNHNLTRMRISIQLPNLRTTLADVQYLLLLKILTAASPHLETSYNPPRDDHKTTKTLESGSNVENKPEITTSSPHGGDQIAADSGSKSPSPAAAPPQRTFELIFIVSEVQFFVVRGWDARPLIDMCLHNFKLTSWTTARKPEESKALDITVKDFLITDHTDTSGPSELRKVAESVGHAKNSAQDSNLFQLEWRKAEDGDMKVQVGLAAIRFNLNPDTVLSIYDYVMSTFTSPEGSRPGSSSPAPHEQAVPSGPHGTQTPHNSKAIEDSKSQDDLSPPEKKSHIEVRLNMHGVTATLADNHELIATVSMERAHLDASLEDALKLKLVIGALSIIDRNEHDIINIEGDNDLVDLRYETTPMGQDGITPTGPTLIFLRMGRVNFHIIEAPLTNLVTFLTKFTAMKAAYDQARMMAFNQAIQVEPNMFQFDVSISTQTIIWPSDDDWLRLNLGDVFLSSEFEDTLNKTKAGIRNVQITSSIGGTEQKLVEETAFTTDLVHSPDLEKISEPIFKANSRLSPIHVHASELQYKLLMQFLASLSKISAGSSSQAINMEQVGNLRRRLAEEKQLESQQASYWWGENFTVSLGGKENPVAAERPKFRFEFEAPLFNTTLTLEQKPLSSFSIENMAVEVDTDKDSTTEANFYLKSISVDDLGNAGSNKFPQIIPPVKNDGQQMMGKLVQRKGQRCVAECSIDSPKAIVALEYLLALKKFMDYGVIENSASDDDESFSEDEDVEYDDDDRMTGAESVLSASPTDRQLVLSRERSAEPNESIEEESDQILENRKSMIPSICISIVDMYLTVLADESDENSEAVVFKIEQLVLNYGATSSLTLSKIGMYLTRMQDFDNNRLRIIDDFNVTGSFDNSDSTETLRLANVQLNMDPLVIKISLREIELLLEIFRKISQIISSQEGAQVKKTSSKTKKATEFFADDHRVVKKGARSQSTSGDLSYGDYTRDFDSERPENRTTGNIEVTRVLAEQLMAQFEGVRLVLIDPLHQLPMTDFCVKPFSLVAKNWSDSVIVSAKAELYANVHSFTKSAWEPLIDTMEIGLKVTGDAIEFFSSTVADVELTPETIELGSLIKTYFDDTSSRYYTRAAQGDGAPYRIRNETGLPITIWADSRGDNHSRVKIANGQEIKWSFHDWRKLRENLNATDQDSSLGVEFDADDYGIIRSVAVNRIGEHMYVVFNGSEKRRVLFDIKVENHLKYVRIRSTELIKNHTHTPLELLVIGPSNREQIRLDAHSEVSLPLSMIDSRILVRREGDEAWSNKSLYWKDLVDHGKMTLACTEDFYLTVNPDVPDVPLSEKYPYLIINLCPPFLIVNNLPQEVVLRLYCRELRREAQQGITKAGRLPVHNFSEDNLLLLRLDVPGFTCNKYAVINTGHRFDKEFHVEDAVELSQSHLRLQIKLEYVDLPGGTGRCIVIYSPYVILNSTDRELIVSGNRNKVISAPSSSTLWSFYSLNASGGGQRVTIGDSNSLASAPVSLDASGATTEVAVVSRDHRRHLYLGVQVTQGSGRYVNTKLVTVSPRFVLCNFMDRPLSFREPGGRNESRADAGERIPVGYVSSMANKEMCVKLADTEDGEWTSSFTMVNVGKNYVRLSEKGKPTILMQVEVILESGSLFVHFTKSSLWPYSIRNFTDLEFVFYQSDPLVDEDGVEIGGHESDEFVPVTYRLPPKSAMPYCWDFPAATVKHLVLEPSSRNPPAKPSRPPRLPSRPSSSIGATTEGSANTGDNSSVVSTNNSDVASISASSRLTKHKSRNSRRVRSRHVQLAEIGELPPANFGEGRIVDISVIADGPQQALVVAPHNPAASNYDASTNNVKAEAIAEVEAIEANTGRTLRLNLKGIGISFITHKAQELFYVTLRNVKISYHLSDALETIALQIQWIQADNSLAGSNNFPVIIYPTVLPKAAEELAAHPCFSASLTRVLDDSYGLIYVKHATLLLQEMTIEADEDFLLAFVDMVVTLVSGKSPIDAHSQVYQPLLDDDSYLCDDLINVPEPSGDAQRGIDVYFEQLHLQPIQLNLSFMRTGSLSSSAIFKDNNVAGGLSFIIDALTLTFGNINDAPVRFNALLVDNVRTEVMTLATMVQMHYQQEFIYQLHKIVGSADIIGNPVGLFNNISSGVMDLFYEPYLGYTLNDRPREFGVGLAKGGLSFMKKSVYGLSDSVSKVTGALSKGLAAMTLDPRYMSQQRARRTRNRPKHAVYGLKYGLESLYESLASGFVGLAEAPMQGAVTDGGSGFIRGLGVGLLGLPTKTTIGLLDFASNVTEGIRNTTTVFDAHEIGRVRLPRVINNDHVLRPYNVRESVGQMILHNIKDGKYLKDSYLAHSNITSNKVVIVSLQRVLVASISDMALEWSVSYGQIDSISVEATGISITLLSDVRGPFIPLSDESTRQYIYKNIAKGVERHNQLRVTMY